MTNWKRGWKCGPGQAKLLKKKKGWEFHATSASTAGFDKQNKTNKKYYKIITSAYDFFNLMSSLNWPPLWQKKTISRKSSDTFK